MGNALNAYQGITIMAYWANAVCARGTVGYAVLGILAIFAFKDIKFFKINVRDVQTTALPVQESYLHAACVNQDIISLLEASVSCALPTAMNAMRIQNALNACLATI